jgi:hypothetical protein
MCFFSFIQISNSCRIVMVEKRAKVPDQTRLGMAARVTNDKSRDGDG